MSRQLTFVDWCAGIGGFRLALEDAGMRCIGSCEIDRWCRLVYEKNFGNKPEFEDAKGVNPDEVPDHDIFCAGFPCQSFSIAGKRRGFADSRGTLFFDICRVVEVKKPGYLLLENVRGLLSAPYVDDSGPVPGTNGWVFYKMLEELGQLGYDVQWQVLVGRNFGIPQNRARVFIVGHLRSLPRPEVYPIELYAGAVADDPGRIRRLSRAFGRINNGQCGRVYTAENIAPTLTADGQLNLHRLVKNPLTKGMEWMLTYPTPEECEVLQGFPRGWTCVRDESGEEIPWRRRRHQCGNTICVPVVKAIGHQLSDAIMATREEFHE